MRISTNAKFKKEGWRHHGWRSCGDVKIPGGPQNVPRYLRCMRCYRLCTHGQVQAGGCACGYRRLNACLELTTMEMVLLKLGWLPLEEWERDAIKPLAGWLGVTIRPVLFRLG